MSEIPQGYEVVSISLRPTLDKMALEIYQLENEICRLKKEVKEAETKGFKNGMLHAADKQQSQLRLLADAVLDNHTNCCDACPEGDIHACSGFAIIGVVNCCQCEACKIAREVQGE